MIKEHNDNLNSDNDLIRQYIELVPHQRKSDDEMGLEANFILDKAEHSKHGELSLFVKIKLFFEKQLIGIKDFIEEAFIGKSSLKPAFILTGAIVIFSIFYYLTFNDSKLQLTEKRLDIAPKSQDTKAIQAETKPKIEEIDRMSLNVSTHSFNNDGSATKFSNELFYKKAYKAISTILKNHKIAIASVEKNSIITEWIQTDNKNVRLIFEKKNIKGPFYIFLIEYSVKPDKESDSVKIIDDLDYKKLAIQIKQKYYNSFEGNEQN